MDCGICTLPNVEVVESAALDALDGSRSWKSLGDEYSINRQSLKNHMEKHYRATPSLTSLAMEGLDPAIAMNIEELQGRMAIASPEIKPFYAIAIQNLKGLLETKPSQQNLIAALKAITEVTGMKQSQTLMIEFARHQFNQLNVSPPPSLEQFTIIDVESSECP